MGRAIVALLLPLVVRADSLPGHEDAVVYEQSWGSPDRTWSTTDFHDFAYVENSTQTTILRQPARRLSEEERRLQTAVLITPGGHAWGHHGACWGWNNCGDAYTCALKACQANGFGSVISHDGGSPCTNYANCNLFYNIDWSGLAAQCYWGNWCQVFGVGSIVCGNPISPYPVCGSNFVSRGPETPTSSYTPAVTPSPLISPTQTGTPSTSQTGTASPSQTASASPSQTGSPSPSSTSIPSGSAARTRSHTAAATRSPTVTPTGTPSNTPSMTPLAAWQWGAWSDCSTQCGEGVRRRSAYCDSRFRGCSGPQPADQTQTCGSFAYSWSIGAWGACAAVPGLSAPSEFPDCASSDLFNTRSVTCTRDDGCGNRVTVADALCPAASKPSAHRPCGSADGQFCCNPPCNQPSRCPPWPLPCGYGIGDPHYVASDGGSYDFQGQGNHLLLAIETRKPGAALHTAMPALGDLDFVAAVRQEHLWASYVAMTTGWVAQAKGGCLAAATQYGFRFKAPGGSWVSGYVPAGCPELSFTGGQVVWESLGVALSGGWGGSYVAMKPSLLGGAYGRAKTWGLYGGFDGDANNDMRNLDGSQATYVNAAGATVPVVPRGWYAGGMYLQPEIEAWGAQYRLDRVPGGTSHPVWTAAREVLGHDGAYRQLEEAFEPAASTANSFGLRGPGAAARSLRRLQEGCAIDDAAARANCGIAAETAQADFTGPQAACYADTLATCDTAVGQAAAADAGAADEARAVVDYNATFTDPEAPSYVGVLDTLFAVAWYAVAPATAGEGGFVTYTIASKPAGASFDADSGVFIWRVRDVDMAGENRAPGSTLSLTLTVSAVTRFANGSIAGEGRPNAQRAFTILASATPLPPTSTPTATPDPTTTPTTSSTPSTSVAATPSAAATRAAAVAVNVRPAAIKNPGAVFRYGSPARLAVVAETAATGREVFISSDNFATATAVEVAPGSAGSAPAEMASVKSGYYGSNSALVFSAVRAGGSFGTMHVLQGTSVCRPTLSRTIVNPLQFTHWNGAIFFVGNEAGSSTRRLWRIAGSEFLSKSLCSGTITVEAVSAFVPASRITVCNGALTFLGKNGAADVPTALIRIPAAGSVSTTALSAAPPSGAAEALPYPRCVAAGAYVAYTTAAGTAAVVSVSDGSTSTAFSADFTYTAARAIAPVGSGIAFGATVTAGGETREALLVWSPNDGLYAANAAATLPASLNWMYASPAGKVFTPCFQADGTAAACVYTAASDSWAFAALGVSAPYSSFAAVGSTVYFAGSVGGAAPQVATVPA